MAIFNGEALRMHTISGVGASMTRCCQADVVVHRSWEGQRTTQPDGPYKFDETLRLHDGRRPVGVQRITGHVLRWEWASVCQGLTDRYDSGCDGIEYKEKTTYQDVASCTDVDHGVPPRYLVGQEAPSWLRTSVVHTRITASVLYLGVYRV